MRRQAPLIAALLLLSAPAFAYLLPGWSLIRKAEGRRAEVGLHSLQVQGSLLLSGDKAQAWATQLHQPLDHGQLSVPAVASYKFPGRCRIELSVPSSSGKAEAVVDRNGILGGAADLAFLQPMLALGCPLLTSRGGEEGTRAITEWMKTFGVDFQTVSLSRFNSAIAEVVGAEARDLASPQVWVDKDEFVPLRVLTKQGSSVFDVRYLDLGAPGSGAETLPRIVELWHLGTDGTGPGEMVARFTGAKADTNAALDDTLFGAP